MTLPENLVCLHYTFCYITSMPQLWAEFAVIHGLCMHVDFSLTKVGVFIT